MKRVFASLANGSLMIFTRKSICPPTPLHIGQARVVPDACKIKCDDPTFREESQDWGEPMILQLSEGMRATAIKCMTYVGQDRLWCGCSNTISVIDTVKLEVVHTFTVFNRRNQLINALVSDGDKVWGIGRQLSKVMEWDAKTYKLLLVFDCSHVEPTDTSLIVDPCTVPDIVFVESDRVDHPREEPVEATPSPKSMVDDDSSGSHEKASIEGSGSPVLGRSPKREHSGFQVTNEPLDTSRTRMAPYSSRNTRKTLRGATRRPRSYNMSKDKANRFFDTRPDDAARQKARDNFLLRQQGATCITDVLLVGETLWIARGMGDILVLNLHKDEEHGKVLGRLALDDSSKYGNRSNQKLALVGNQYVISSQWLEEISPRRGSAPNVCAHQPSDSPLPRSGTIFQADPTPTSHQQITVWEAWDYWTLKRNTGKVSEMFALDSESENI